MLPKSLNFTIGAVKSAAFPIFVEDGDGEFHFKSTKLRKIYSNIFERYGHFKVKIKLADEEEGFGVATENGYENGVFGLLQRHEIDSLYCATSIRQSALPGVVGPVVMEDLFKIRNYYHPASSAVEQVSDSLDQFEPLIWLFGLSLALLVEYVTRLSSSSQMGWTQVITYAFKSILGVPQTVFGQFYGDRSLSRTSLIIGITLITMIFGAAFNTELVVRTSQRLPETLRDAVELDRTPFFFDAGSEYELFYAGITKDFADVMALARAKGTDRVNPAGSTDHWDQASPKVSLFLSTFQGSALDVMDEYFIRDKTLKVHVSSQPYAASNMAYVITDEPGKAEYRTRLTKLSLRLFESGIYPLFFSSIKNIFLTENGLPWISFSKLAQEESMKGAKVIPLSLDRYRTVFSLYFYACLAIVFIFIIEMLLKLKNRLSQKS